MGKFNKKFRDGKDGEDSEHFNRPHEKKGRVKWYENETESEDVIWPYGSLGEEIPDQEEE